MNAGRVLREAERTGQRDAARYGEEPSIIRTLALGAFTRGSGPLALFLRRVLLALHVPPALLASVRRVVWPASKNDPVGLFLRQYAYWRGVRRIMPGHAWKALSRGPVILMYHAVGDAEEPPSCYVVSGSRFRLQMMWLRLCRYHMVRLSDLVDDLRHHRLPPARAVAVTFDDGYADNHRVARPILERFHIPSTVFLVSGVIGGKANWTSEPALAGRKLLTEADIDAMLASGVDVGAHTRTHASLTGISPGPDRHDEVAGSRSDLERRLAQPTPVFAYPYGDLDPDVVDTVRRAGFDAACCSRSGVNDPATPLHELRRVEVRGTDSFLRFVFMVWCGRRGRRAAGVRAPAVVARAN